MAKIKLTDLDEMADAIIEHRKQQGVLMELTMPLLRAGLARDLDELGKAMATSGAVTDILADIIFYALGGLRLSMGKGGNIQNYLEGLIERSNPL